MLYILLFLTIGRTIGELTDWTAHGKMLISPYEPNRNYFIVAVPKLQNFAKKPDKIDSIEIVKSIEVPFDQVQFATEMSEILTRNHADHEKTKIRTRNKLEPEILTRNHADHEKTKIRTRNNIEPEVLTGDRFEMEKSEILGTNQIQSEVTKHKRSHETGNISLFRTETVNGYRALFQRNDKKIEGVEDKKSLMGPVLLARGPINIISDNPNLVNVIGKGSLKSLLEVLEENKEFPKYIGFNKKYIAP